MPAPPIRVDVDGSVATVTVDRPPVNAMDRALFADLRDTFRSFEDRPQVHAVVLASASPKAFLAGLDIKAYNAAAAQVPSPDQEFDPVRLDPGKLMRESFDAVYECAVPVIAAVDGPAIGGGLAVVACCDMIIASPKASFRLTEVSLGLLGAGSHLLRMVGPYRMREAFYTCQPVSAEDAYRCGAISRIVPSESLLDEALALAKVIADQDPIALRLGKVSLNRSEYFGIHDGYRIEQDYTARLKAVLAAGKPKVD